MPYHAQSSDFNTLETQRYSNGFSYTLQRIRPLMKYIAAFLLLLTLGCGPNITSGEVVGLKTIPAYTVPAHTTTSIVPCGKCVIPIVHRHPERHYPESYKLIVRGHDHGKWADIEVSTDEKFGGYKMGDKWRENE
jgi:hypothetical protein